MARIAVYGNLKEGFSEHKLIDRKDTNFISYGYLTNFRLYSVQKDTAFVSPEDNYKTKVEVYDIPDLVMRMLRKMSVAYDEEEFTILAINDKNLPIKNSKGEQVKLRASVFYIHKVDIDGFMEYKRYNSEIWQRGLNLEKYMSKNIER